MKTTLLCLLAILTAFTCLQCTKSTEPEAGPPSSQDPPSQPEPVRTPAELTVAEKKLVQSSNEFGFNLFRAVSAEEDPDSNVFISPLSASFALGMTWNGAALETRDEMTDVLAYGDMTPEQINTAYHDVTAILTAADPVVELAIANAIWHRMYPYKEIHQEYIDLCNEYFDAPVRAIDFQAPGAADTINHWVQEHTNGKIDTIIKPPIPADLALLLANATYFKGSWTHQFDPDSTRDAEFYCTSRPPEACRMMMRYDTIMYVDNDFCYGADLPYGNGLFGMVILLPKSGVSLTELIESLTPETWEALIGGYSEREMTIGLPKLKFDYEICLNQVLQSMGMVRAFMPFAAQFYNMFVDSTGWIDTVKQKTFVQIDEEGTEAAAVTVVSMFDTAFQDVVANRPFVFVMHERTSGTILFMGKIVRPAWNE